MESNTNLGVPVWLIFGAGAVVCAALIGVLIAGLALKRAVWSAFAIGGGGAWLLLALNDRWGANAEPYRMWIDAFTLLAVTSLPMIVDVARGVRGAERVDPAAPGARRWFAVGGLGLILLVGASAVDYVRFVADPNVHGIEESLSPGDRAAAELARASDADETGALIATDPCIVPLYLKVNSGAPIAFFHLGMAWPARHDPLGDVVVDRNAGDFPVAAARNGGVGWVLTDSSCDWEERYGDVLEHEASITTESGTVTLWRLRGGAATSR